MENEIDINSQRVFQESLKTGDSVVNLHSNEMNLNSDEQKIEQICVEPILIKNEIEDDSNVKICDSESLKDVTSNAIHKLDKIIQSFKNSFIDEKSDNIHNDGTVKINSENIGFVDSCVSESLQKIQKETVDIDSESNICFENSKGVLTEFEPEGHILEHKSINSLTPSDTLELTQNYYLFQNVFKSHKENTNQSELLNKDEGEHSLFDECVETEKADSHTFGSYCSKDTTPELVNPFETLCELLQEEDFDQKTEKNISTPEAIMIKDSNKQSFLCKSKSSNKIQDMCLGHGSTSSTTLQNDNFHDMKLKITLDTDSQDNNEVKVTERISYIIERNSSAVERNSSAVESNRSAVERISSTVERTSSAVERNNSAVERISSTVERTSSAVERNSSAIERNSSAVERVFILEGDLEVDIHEAIRRNNECLVRHLLYLGADPDEPDWRGTGDPPIVLAALKQNIAIIKALCMAGCDVNLTSVRGETALHMAVARRPVSLPLIDVLLAAGCHANTQDKLRGCAALHCVAGFADDEPQLFCKLAAVTDVNLRDHRQGTVLHRVAATSSNVAWIKQLLDLGADLSVQNDRGETALCVALERGWEAGAMALVAGGTDLCLTNLYHETVLHVAARHNQACVVAALLRAGAEVNAQDLAGNTALHLAAGRGYIDTVRQLLTCPHVDLDTYNGDYATPLTCAVESGFISVVQMLVDAKEVDLEPALDVAKQSYRRLSQPEMCQLLTRELARRQTPHLT